MRYIKEVLMYKFLKNASYILVLLGALNWGLVGLFGFDLFDAFNTHALCSGRFERVGFCSNNVLGTCR